MKQLLKVQIHVVKRGCALYEEEGQVVLLGVFNTRVGKSSKLNDVLGIFGEVKCSMCVVGRFHF